MSTTRSAPLVRDAPVLDAPVLVGRRERKKLQTRAAIHTAALRLFAEKGYDGTTLADITEAADVAPRTFFLHFAGKEDLLLGNSTADMAVFDELMHARPAEEDAFESVRAALLELVRLADLDVSEEAVLTARLLQESPQVIGKVFQHYVGYERVVADFVAARSGTDAEHDVYPALVATVVISAMRSALSLWYRRGAHEPRTPLVAEMLDTLAVGLTRQDRP